MDQPCCWELAVAITGQGTESTDSLVAKALWGADAFGQGGSINGFREAAGTGSRFRF